MSTYSNPIGRARGTPGTGAPAISVDVRLTPASTDGAASAACLTPRAKALFLADEIVLSGPVRHWLLEQAAEASLIVD